MLDRLERNWSNFFWKRTKSLGCSFCHRVYCHLFTKCFHSRHLHKKPSLTQAQYVPDIINLTVVDLLVGTVAGPSIIFEPDNLETDLGLEQDFSWQSFVYLTLQGLFLVASLVNISLISLERLNATLFPFRHCLVGKRVYLIIILCSWLFSLVLLSVIVLLDLRLSPAHLYAILSYSFFSLLILTVSCAIIISTVKKNPLLPNAGQVLSTERKLTVTLFIVTVAFFSDHSSLDYLDCYPLPHME